MRYKIDYERNDKRRTTGTTTYCTREKDPITVIGRFEKMHGGRLKVLACESKRRLTIPLKRRKTYELIIAVNGQAETHTFETLSDAADQVKFYAENCVIMPDSICITENI